MLKPTRKAAPKRELIIISLNDENVRAKSDGGTDRNGMATTSRRQVGAMLSKTEKVGGKKLPLFMLKEPPAKSYHDDDPFDAQYLRNRKDGSWIVADDEWLAVRAERIKLKAERLQSRAGALASAQAHEVLKVVGAMSGNLAQVAAAEQRKQQAAAKPAAVKP